jgi:restriction system protein
LKDALSRIAWQDFEILVANRYRRHGWEVAHCGDGRPGFRAETEVDLRMKKDGQLALVQCRHESLVRLDAGTVEKLLATAAEERATQVIVIASADLPDDVRQLAESGGATVIEGTAVRQLLDDDLLDLQPARMVAVADAERRRARMITQGKLPRLGRRTWGLPIFLAALTALGLVAFYGATIAHSRFEHPSGAATPR